MIVELIPQEDGSSILPLPEEVTKALNIGVGSEITMTPQADGSITIERKNKLKVFAVETVVTFRNVYFVEAESAEHAKDFVVMNECTGEATYFQNCLGEQISDAYEVDNATMLRLLQNTERPKATLESVLDTKWRENAINVVDYTK